MEASFWSSYSEAVLTSLSFFWKALWAFILGYVVSSLIQVFVTRERMRRTMGHEDARSVGTGTFFGFISSSCSFAALATTKSLFAKGAGFVPSLAFLLASTNLVIELGIIIAIFLGWQFVVGEYVGGLLLIGLMWFFVRLTRPAELIERAREHSRSGGDREDGESRQGWREKIRSRSAWRKVANRYFMEWGMVWKDVTVGFTLAGVIATFVPRSFFQTLFIGAGREGGPGFLAVLEHALVGPLAAFFTFIGSMGNIPLAAVLYTNGVSFAGVMAFIFSDLVVFPVLRINAKYYGWKMALYIVAVFLGALVATAVILHYAFLLLGVLPQGTGQETTGETRFAVDHTLFLNLAFLALSGVLAWLRWGGGERRAHAGGGERDLVERILLVLALASYAWLIGGLIVTILV